MKNKLVFIGNSIVNGFPMSRGRSFPGQVRKALKEGLDTGGKVPLYGDVINKGVNGETTLDILNRFEHDVLDHEPRAVFIMTGTNDFIFREADPEGCMVNLEKMARMAEEAGIIPVYLTPLPVDAEKAERMWMSGMGMDYVQINEEIQLFSQMIAGSGRLYVDTGAAYRAFAHGGESQLNQPLDEIAENLRVAAEAIAQKVLGEKVECPALSADAYLDGVHPTAEGQRFLATVVLDWLTAYAGELGLN